MSLIGLSLLSTSILLARGLGGPPQTRAQVREVCRSRPARSRRRRTSSGPTRATAALCRHRHRPRLGA